MSQVEIKTSKILFLLQQLWTIHLATTMQYGTVIIVGIKPKILLHGQVWSTISQTTNSKASRITTLIGLFIFLLTIFIFISFIRICVSFKYNITIPLKSPVGFFIIGFSFLVLVISTSISATYYVHRYRCAKANCGTEDYIKPILHTARLYLFLFFLSLGEIIQLLPKVTTTQVDRIWRFSKSLQFLLFAFVIMNFNFIQKRIPSGIWLYGKVAILAILLFVTAIVTFAQNTGYVNVVVMILFGTITGFTYSLIFDWIIVHANPEKSGEVIEMRR
jgi:hypothetical protein